MRCLTDLLPGGLEIENFNLTDAKQWADVVVDGITITDRGSAPPTCVTRSSATIAMSPR